MSIKIDELKWHVQKVLPAVYDDSLSYYELISKVLAKLNEVVKEVNEYFKEDIEVHVSAILTEWKNDGTLDHIITGSVFQGFNDRLIAEENATIETQEDILATTHKIDTVAAGIKRFFIDVTTEGVKNDGSVNTHVDIQRLLDLAGQNRHITLFFPEGTYLLGDTLRTRKNTSIYCTPRTFFKRNGNYGSLLVNGNLGDSYSGYNGNGNLSIIGGVWDGNIAEQPYQFNHFTLGHAENIHIEDVTFKDNYDNHHIEINGLKNVKIINNQFKGHVTSRNLVEAIQIDLMKSSEQFPPFGLYDNTVCRDILIDGNHFENVRVGVGSHSATSNIYHKNITIVNNTFLNCTHLGVFVINWQDFKIANNSFMSCGGGIQIDGSVSSIIDGFSVTGNTFKDMIGTGDSGRAIRLSGANINGGVIRNGSITGNVIERTTSHGIQLESSRRLTVTGNTIQFAGGEGIGLYLRCEHVVVSGNTINQCSNNGILLYNGISQSIISNNIVFWNNGNGIALQEGSYDNNIIGNTVHANNLGDLGASNISIVSSSRNNVIQGNVCLQGSETIKPASGIALTSTAANNVVIGNDVRTGGLNDLGSSTIKQNNIA